MERLATYDLLTFHSNHESIL